MRFSYLLFYFMLVGCQRQVIVSESALQKEVKFRAATTVGNAIHKLRRQSGRFQHVDSFKSDIAHLSVFIKGPSSLTGSVQIPGVRIEETIVYDLKKLVIAEENGIRISARLRAKTWPQQLSITYVVDERRYTVTARKVNDEWTFYDFIPELIKIGKRRTKPVKIFASTQIEPAKLARLAAVEKRDNDVIFYYMQS